MRRVLGLAVPVLLVLAAVAVLVVFPRGSSSAGDRAAWFESPPADGEVVTGRVPVVAAATDPIGISVLEFFVDGEFVAGRLYEGAPERVEAEFAWLVNREGSFRLTVRARGTDGLWGVPETIVVAAAHHYRSEEALSPQSTTTAAASDATCAPQPSLLSPGDGATVGVRPTLEWSYEDEGCRVAEQTLHFTGPTLSGPDDLTVELPIAATSWRPPPLVDCAAYTWHVDASGGGEAGESAAWRFSTDFAGDC